MELAEALEKLKTLGYTAVRHSETSGKKALIVGEQEDGTPQIFRLEGGRLKRRLEQSNHGICFVEWEEVG